MSCSATCIRFRSTPTKKSCATGGTFALAWAQHFLTSVQWVAPDDSASTPDGWLQLPPAPGTAPTWEHAQWVGSTDLVDGASRGGIASRQLRGQRSQLVGGGAGAKGDTGRRRLRRSDRCRSTVRSTDRPGRSAREGRRDDCRQLIAALPWLQVLITAKGALQGPLDSDGRRRGWVAKPWP
jgi:hypothetical protein